MPSPSNQGSKDQQQPSTESAVCGVAHLKQCLKDIGHHQAGIWTSPLRLAPRDAIWLLPFCRGHREGPQPTEGLADRFPTVATITVGNAFHRCAGCDKALTAGWVRGRNGQRYARYWCWRKGCKAAASKEELEDNFCILLAQIQPTAELLAKLPAIAPRTWETRKEQIAENAKGLTRRLEEQRALNLRTIKSKIDATCLMRTSGP